MTTAIPDLSHLPEDQETQNLSKLVADALDDMKALDLRFLNVKGVSSVCDVMVVASGSSNRHVKSIADNVIEKCKKNDIEILGSEGQDSSEWVLVDLGIALVHIMQEQTRSFYELEKLWNHRPSDLENQENEFDEDDLLGREFDEEE